MAKVITSKPITVKINGKTHELVANLRAVRAIVNTLGGINPAFKGVRDYNVDTTAAVIIAGAGLSFETDKDVDAFVEGVFQADRQVLNDALGRYFSRLFNGGREPSKDDAKAKDEAEDAGNA